ncbi:MAG: hypothetical protein JNK23_10465 [Opitutaceae bacterium]|nr:hypothetical protein [Opitutaceae bacterium]
MKADQQWKLMLAECEVSEAGAVEDQMLMGDACKDLREAHGLPRNALALKLRMDSMQIAELERRCSSVQARKYRAAVLSLASASSVVKGSK